MRLLLFLLFFIIPVVEIAAFIEVGGMIGLWPTLLLIIATALAGAMLLRYQGLRTFLDAQRQMRAGEAPVQAMWHGLFLVIAGVLLLTPGFVTDAIGLALFIPPLRLWLATKLVSWLMPRTHVRMHAEHRRRGGAGDYEAPCGPSRGQGQGRGPVIEGEYTDLDRQEKRNETGTARGAKETNGNAEPDKDGQGRPGEST